MHWFSRSSNVCDSGAGHVRLVLPCEACQLCEARSTRCLASSIVLATGRCRRPCRQSAFAVSAADGRADIGSGRRSLQGWFPRVGLPPGRPIPSGFPEEHPCHRPPPSTLYPCHAWFCRLQRPLFGRGETAVDKRLAPVQQALVIQFTQKRPPDRQPHILLFPVVQSTPTRRRGRILRRQILPPRPTTRDPQNAFQYPAAIRPGTASPLALAQLGQQRHDLFPLPVRQHRAASWHSKFLLPPYRPMPTASPSTALDSESGYETASRQINPTAFSPGSRTKLDIGRFSAPSVRLKLFVGAFHVPFWMPEGVWTATGRGYQMGWNALECGTRYPPDFIRSGSITFVTFASAAPALIISTFDTAPAGRKPKGIDMGCWEQTAGNLGGDGSQEADTASSEISSHSCAAVLRIERRLNQLIAALGLFGIEPCSFCGSFFRSSEPAALFHGNGEQVCVGCIHEWWPMRCEQLDVPDREVLDHKLAHWLIDYHNGKMIRQFQQVLQIPLQEFRIVATCSECGGAGRNCRFCDGHGTVWVVAPD